MEKSLFKKTLSGIVLTGIFGTLLHFVYQWSGQAKWVAPFCAVNESTWEHLKLLFIPCFILFLIEHFLTKREFPGLLTRRIQGLLCGLAFIPIGFYTYTGIIGRSYMAVDIILFIVAVLLAWIGSSRFYQKCKELRKNSAIFVVILFFLMFLFIWFTFQPPHITLFIDPQNLTFGVHNI